MGGISNTFENNFLKNTIQNSDHYYIGELVRGESKVHTILRAKSEVLTLLSVPSNVKTNVQGLSELHTETIGKSETHPIISKQSKLMVL